MPRLLGLYAVAALWLALSPAAPPVTVTPVDPAGEWWVDLPTGACPELADLRVLGMVGLDPDGRLDGTFTTDRWGCCGYEGVTGTYQVRGDRLTIAIQFEQKPTPPDLRLVRMRVLDRTTDSLTVVRGGGADRRVYTLRRVKR